MVYTAGINCHPSIRKGNYGFESSHSFPALLLRCWGRLCRWRWAIRIPRVANVEPFAVFLFRDGKILSGIDHFPCLVLQHVGTGGPAHVTTRTPGGVGAERECETLFSRLWHHLREEGANRGPSMRGRRTRREEHRMLIILSSHRVSVAAVKGLDPDVVNGVECRHLGRRICGE